MTVQELIDMLEGVDPDMEVRLAFQPNYPMEYTVAGVTQTPPEPEEEQDPRAEPQAPVVYLLEGAWAGYASRDLWNQ